MNFLRRLALKGAGLDDSSRLDVDEIARVPDVLPSLFPSWSYLEISGLNRNPGTGLPGCS